MEPWPRIIGSWFIRALFLVDTFVHIPVLFEAFLRAEIRTFDAKFYASRALQAGFQIAAKGFA